MQSYGLKYHDGVWRHPKFDAEIKDINTQGHGPAIDVFGWQGELLVAHIKAAARAKHLADSASGFAKLVADGWVEIPYHRHYVWWDGLDVICFSKDGLRINHSMSIWTGSTAAVEHNEDYSVFKIIQL
jgi:hypothetical protein